MPEDRIDPQPQKGEKLDKTENLDPIAPERFESDAQKIVHRHLENEDDIITHEDIASIRVGLTQADLDEATESRFGDEEQREAVEKKILGDVDDIEEEENTKKDQITPWDTLNPS